MQDRQLDSEAVGQPQQTRRVLSPDHIDCWTNDCMVGHTPWDFRLMFGRTAQENNELVSVDRATVYMSPQLAKRLIAVLEGNVKRYENMYGEINLPYITIDCSVSEEC